MTEAEQTIISKMLSQSSTVTPTSSTVEQISTQQVQQPAQQQYSQYVNTQPTVQQASVQQVNTAQPTATQQEPQVQYPNVPEDVANAYKTLYESTLAQLEGMKAEIASLKQANASLATTGSVPNVNVNRQTEEILADMFIGKDRNKVVI